MKLQNPEDQIYVLDRGNDAVHVMKSIILSGVSSLNFSRIYEQKISLSS